MIGQRRNIHHAQTGISKESKRSVESFFNTRPNPKTGEMVPITARRVVTFRASHLLKEACLGIG
ncbi:hypothetical protein HAP67_11440 [Acidithiobacillus albertensis]|uniref:HU family DNA-binding protein n=1 Tax=Acidithiobacillus thiooxidans TaxID=930 RepID=UPI000983828D|nr:MULTISPECIES: HU family DNA-binding protein [Acidithiobacillus]MBU2742261.1 hypothetical protein [Acidithiobacillus albertensis]